jgi:molybdate transport system substrate-binding protein
VRKRALCVAALVLSGCSSTDRSSAATDSCKEPDTKGSIVVMAASSMVNVFTDVEKTFLSAHPCITGITYSYGSSATLAAQIVNGSPADVFVSANEATMTTAKDAGKTNNVSLFANNAAEVMVSPTSRFVKQVTDIASLSDAVNSGIKVGLCVATAPCGSLANFILEKAGTTRSVITDTESPSVEDLVTKIEMGELDAGIVYRSDCQYARKRSAATCVGIPSAVNSTNGYYVAALTARPIAQQYVDYIKSEDFKSTLQTKFGFLAP